MKMHLVPNQLSKTWLIATALLLSALAHAADTAQFDVANRLYESKKFAEAKQSYEGLVKSGPLSANLFYNLGNTEWKLGNSGQAVVDYERALMLEPSHPEARTNLEFVRNQTGARLAVPAWWEQALGAMSANAAAVLLTLSLWVAIFALSVALLRHERRVSPLLTTGICLMVVAYSIACLWESKRLSDRSIIITKSAAARQAPADVAPVADVLPAGSEVFAPEIRGAWTYCTLPNGIRAWVPTDAVEPLKQT